MQSKLYKISHNSYTDHPRFAGVKLAVLVDGKLSNAVSVSLLEISPDVEIPVHTHDPQLDSIFVLSGQGEAYINGVWQAIQAGDYIFAPSKAEHGIRNTGRDLLRLFVHHSPPLL
jgi:quercetin dioxygenase-like cupin family protein